MGAISPLFSVYIDSSPSPGLRNSIYTLVNEMTFCLKLGVVSRSLRNSLWTKWGSTYRGRDSISLRHQQRAALPPMPRTVQDFCKFSLYNPSGANRGRVKNLSGGTRLKGRAGNRAEDPEAVALPLLWLEMVGTTRSAGPRLVSQWGTGVSAVTSGDWEIRFRLVPPEWERKAR